MVLTAASHDPPNADIQALYADLTGTASLRVHRNRRRPHLCPARHQHRHAPHRHRPDSGNKQRRSHRGRPCGKPRRTSGFDRNQAAAAPASGCRRARRRLRRAVQPRQAPVRARSNAASSLPAPQELPQAAAEIIYEAREATLRPKPPSATGFTSPIEVQSIGIAGAKPHPTKLVQSAAMASVRAAHSFLPAACCHGG